MHWFWRAAGASAFGTLVLLIGVAFTSVLFLGHNWLLFFILVALVPLGSHFVAVLMYHDPVEKNYETRCRKCQYILRGITEPRCPECGERI